MAVMRGLAIMYCIMNVRKSIKDMHRWTVMNRKLLTTAALMCHRGTANADQMNEEKAGNARRFVRMSNEVSSHCLVI